MNSLDPQAVESIAVRAVQIYAEMHPRPPHVTQKQAGEMLRLSAPTIGRLVKAGILRLNSAGQIPVSEVDAVLQAKRVA